MEDVNEMEMDFKDALSKMPEIKPGEAIMAKIVAIGKEGILVDLGLKSEGIIPIREFEHKGIPVNFTPGTEIPVVPGQGYEDGHRIVSYNNARLKVAWKKVVELNKTGQPVEGTIVKKIQGGYIVDVGIDAFMPASQVDMRSVGKGGLNEGAKINVMVAEIDSRKKSAVVSHRKYADVARKVSAEKIFSTLAIGDVIEGKITGITEFGAFADIGGIEGLIHISDMAWHRVEKAGDIVKTGETVKVKVLKINKDSGKISLGLKHLQIKPWEKIGEKYVIGSAVKGRVTSITGFGAFVEIEPGIEGLLHISEVSWTEKPSDLKKLIKVGDELEVKILDIIPEKEKLSLSLKQLGASPWDELKEKYPEGTRVKCKVTNLAPFGAFVELPDKLEGLIHVQDMSWTKKVRHPQEMVNTGDEIDAVIIEVKPEEQKATLSLKHLKENPFEKFAAGKIVSGKVTKIIDFGAYVKLDDDIEAFMHKSEMSREKGKHPAELLNIGQDVEVKVIKSDPSSKKIDVSIKRLEMDKERELIDKYSDNPKQQLSDILEESD